MRKMRAEFNLEKSRKLLSLMMTKENLSPMEIEGGMTSSSFRQTFKREEKRLLFKEVKVALYNNDAYF